jgi:hypothetical protein
MHRFRDRSLAPLYVSALSALIVVAVALAAMALSPAAASPEQPGRPAPGGETPAGAPPEAPAAEAAGPVLGKGEATAASGESALPVEGKGAPDTVSGEKRTPKVGIQVGHWRPWEAPEELRRLRFSIGAFQDDWGESIVNMDISRRVAALLEREGVEVELLPATVLPDYRADAFVSIHGDANPNTKLSGFKISHSIWSEIPEVEDLLVADLVREYEAATRLKEHRKTITDNMTQYYPFNQKLEHSVHPLTPAVIVELGFLTTESDRKLLRDEPDRAAEGIARGILSFLERESRPLPE